MNPVVTEITPNQPWWRLEWREIWARRYLWRLLVMKDLLASYKQSLLGPLWFVIQPVITAVLFAVVFGKFAGLTPAGAPRFLFFLAATVPWSFFHATTSGVAGSLVASAPMLGKVYFPRLISPLASAGSAAIHFVLNYLVFVCFYLGYCRLTGYDVPFPAWGPAWIALMILSVAALGLGTGLWFASAGVRYRDIRFSLPVILQTWMFATPIIYPSTIIPERWQALFFLNPMAGIVETHRHVFFGTAAPPPALLALGATTIAILLVTSLFVFNRTQRTFIDVI